MQIEWAKSLEMNPPQTQPQSEGATSVPERRKTDVLAEDGDQWPDPNEVAELLRAGVSGLHQDGRKDPKSL